MPDLEGNKKGEETSTPLHAYKEGREEDIAEETTDPNNPAPGGADSGASGRSTPNDAGGPLPLGEEPSVPSPTTPADPGGARGSLSDDNPDSPAADPTEGGGTQTPLEGPDDGGPGAGQQGSEGIPPRR